MRTYPLDIDPVQVVRWIMAEYQAAPSRFRILARRASEVREIPAREELHLGDEEREDLTEVDTIATLEIAPARASEGWLLTVEVEDEAGPRLPERGPLVEGEGQIDLRTFYDEFIRPGRGIANVVAEVEDDAAEVHLNKLVSSIEKNRHGPSQTSPKLSRGAGQGISVVQWRACWVLLTCSDAACQKPAFALASGADAAVDATTRAAVGTFRPLIGRERTSNDARTFGSEWQRFRAFLANLVKRPGHRVASRAYPHGAITPGRAQSCGCFHPALRIGTQNELYIIS
jgi:hypothetical protein